VGASLWLVGFGRDDHGVAGIKWEVLTSLVEIGESGRELRAGGGGNDTCSGDSGGPALVQFDSGLWRIAGVASRGPECGQGGFYVVVPPDLCWLGGGAGVELLGTGCENCYCVEFGNEDRDDVGCKGTLTSRHGPAWLGLLVCSLLAIGSQLN